MRRTMTLAIAGSLLLLGSAVAVAAPATFRASSPVFRDPMITNPSAVRVDADTWRLYYMVTGSTYSALSTDGQGTAYALEGVRLPGAAHPAAVVLPDGRVRLYYVPGDPGARPQVLSAVSSDGLAFTPEPGVRLDLGVPGSPDAHGMIHLSAVALPSGGLRLYYDAVHAPATGSRLGWGRAILSATSPDGLSFTRDAGARVTPRLAGLREGSMVWSPEVYRHGGRYVMLFTFDTRGDQRRHGGIYQASSADGLRFRLDSRRPVWGVLPGASLQEGPGGAAGLPQDPTLLQLSDGVQRLLYWLPREGTGSAVR